VDNLNLVGIVTVTYNSESVIHDFLQSVISQSHSAFLLYVVDNASVDRTLSLLLDYRDPRFRIIRNTENVGIAEGNNIGIRAALRDGCSSVLLLNNDTVFEADLLSKLLGGLQDLDCDMIVPKILYFAPPDKLWCAGGTFSRWRGCSRHLGFNKKDDGKYDEPKTISFGPACCMLLRSDVFSRVGFMDPKYFVYFDDTDFCLRAYRAGAKLMYLPAARLYHKVSSLIGYRSEIALRFVTRNHVYYVMKNFRPWVLYYLPICQIHVIRRSLQMKTMRAFMLMQRAFWEGVMLRDSPCVVPHSLSTGSRPLAPVSRPE
jgi:hypothetical protein